MVESRLDVILNFIKKGTGAKEGSKAMGGLGEAIGVANKKAKEQTLQNLASKVAIGALTVAAIKQIPQMAQLGFRYENAQIALAAYAGSTEEATAITEAIIVASGGAISKFDAVTNATRLLSLGLANNADEAAKFTKTAVTLGATMGKDVQGAFEEFSLLLANQSILRLDTYGISGAKVREEMARLAAEFPELDRNARFVNATMTIAEEKMGKLEDAGFQAVSGIDRLGAEWEDLKVTIATAVADAVLPAIDALQDLKIAHMDAEDVILENSDSYEEYKDALQEAGIVGGFFTKSNVSLTEAEWDAVKATQALTEANEDLGTAEEEVILTQGGINELLQEQTFLAKALSLGIGGTLTKAMEKYEDSMVKVGDKQADMREKARDLEQELRLVKQEAIDLTNEFEAGKNVSQSYSVATESLRIKQKALEKQLKAGKISSEKYKNETDKVALQQAKLDEAVGTSQEAFIDYNETMGELQQQQTDIQEQMNELGVAYEATGDDVDQLAESLKRATAELIFQAAAADLDAQTSLILARELGLVDEATFAVAQQAQRLRIIYDETGQSAEDFASDVGDLAESVGSLQDKDIEINVNTLGAEQDLRDLEEQLARFKANRIIELQKMGTSRDPEGMGRGFQHGADFMIPDTGPMGDRHPVSFLAERGERVTVTPRDGSAPAGGGGGVSIGTVNLGSSLDLAFFKNTLERIR